MQDFIPQPQSLLRFLNAIDDNLSTAYMNVLDTDVSFVSKYYTPQIQLSELAKNKLKQIQNEDTPTLEREFNNNTIVKKVEKTQLKLQAPRIYIILQTIILEAYAMVNCFIEHPESLKYLTQQDVKITRENVNYVADYLSDYDEYNSVVLDLRDLDMCFNTIELQLPLIKKESES